MKLFGKEHCELMDEFEKIYKHECLDKEDRELWSKGIIYQNGQVNKLFLAFRWGYAVRKGVEL